MKNTGFASVNTIIGEGTSVTGDLKIAGSIRIEGDLYGSIEAEGWVQVGQFARIKGDIVAEAASVGGIVEGNIIAKERTDLFETAVVFGNIETKHLSVDNDVLLNGQCNRLKSDDDFLNAKTQNAQKQANKKSMYR